LGQERVIKYAQIGTDRRDRHCVVTFGIVGAAPTASWPSAVAWLALRIARALKPAPPVPTLGELNRYEPHWVWWWCPKCHREVAVPLAPFIIRWGANASSDLLRKNPRCTKCGQRGGLLQMPSIHTSDTPYLPFPVEEGLR
jgi:hypothetical protein